MEKAQKYFTEQLAEAVKDGHQVARIDVEFDDVDGVLIYALDVQDSVLAAVSFQSDVPLTEIEETFNALAGIAIGTETAMAEIKS